jgi:hypothetical protein
MADINIQPKKSAPSPWLLVVLTGVVLALAAYFFLRPDPADEPGPVTAAQPTAPAPASAVTSVADEPTPTCTGPTPTKQADTTGLDSPQVLTPSELAAYAATDAAAPAYARRGLQQLATTLVDLTDRADLQDPAIQEQRNNLTSATVRLSEDEKAPLRPGFVAAAELMRTIQQKAYPEQEAAAVQLQQLAQQLSGRTATADDQQQVRKFLTVAATLLDPLSQPAAIR